ncbi:MAG: RNA polymerase sigma-70 factor [Bacteroidales bacterium]|nr:RNA polymerase sigma-70 factor [Bacteroidales bacterium]
MARMNAQAVDEILAARIRQSDKEAFRILYNRYSDRLYRFSLKHTGNADEARDVVQTVFINVWEHRTSLNPEGQVKSYIYRITVNILINYFKKRSQHFRVIESLKKNDQSLSDMTYEQIFFKDLETTITAIVKTLPQERQRIFNMSHNDGLSHQEIAEKLDISVRTVENQIYRAVKEIRLILKQRYLSY